MLYVILTLFLAVFPFNNVVYGAESWLCTEDSSQIIGTSIYACGMGQATNEAEARHTALTSAQAEFNAVCGVDSPCGENQYSVKPQRATCSKVEGFWVCHRLIVYTIESQKKVPERHNSPTLIGHNEYSNQELMDMAINRAMTGLLNRR